MATLIPEIALSELKRLKVAELRQLQSAEIFADGLYLFTFINPQTDFVRDSAENLGQLSNSVAGKRLEDISKLEVR